MESLAAHYASMKGDGNPAKRPEVRKKIGDKKRGYVMSAESRQKISNTRHERFFKGKRGFNRMDKLWRMLVIERDGGICQICGSKPDDINTDHIKPVRYFPELRYELSNGRTLCVPCHKKTDTWGRGSTKYKDGML